MDVTSNPRSRSVDPRSRDPTRRRAGTAAGGQRRRSTAQSSIAPADDEDCANPNEEPASLPQVTESGPSRTLYAFVGLTVLAGVGSLVWATLAFPLRPAIALQAPEIVGSSPAITGLVFWLGFGFLGSFHTSRIDGHAVVTFHLPFIVAAMLLGGPAAGGWVAFISTLELREIREVPVHGTLANHTALAFSAVAGGIVAMAVEPLASAWVTPDATVLVAAVAGASTFGVLSVAHTAIIVSLREHLTPHEALILLGGSGRRTLAAECVVAWVLVFTYASMGWWAPLVCVALVLLAWEAHDDRERVAHDEMTGLLSRHAILRRLSAATDRVSQSGIGSLLIMLDLDGFKAINDEYGHAIGDEVLQIVSERLRGAIRVTDAAARMGGDEFVLVLPGVRDSTAAEVLARRIHARLAEPIAMTERDVRVGSSLGLVLVDRASVPIGRLLAEADRAMYAAKRAGGGICVAGRRPAEDGGTSPSPPTGGPDEGPGVARALSVSHDRREAD